MNFFPFLETKNYIFDAVDFFIKYQGHFSTHNRIFAPQRALIPNRLL